VHNHSILYRFFNKRLFNLLYFGIVYTSFHINIMVNFNKLLYSPFFQNKIVLYGSLFAVILTLLRFLANRNYNGIMLLTLIGLLMTYFSKNMIIVLLTAFVSVTVFDMLQFRGMVEGMKASKDSDAEDADTEDSDTKEKKKDEDDDVSDVKEGQETLHKNSKTKKDGNTTITIGGNSQKKSDDDKPDVKSQDSKSKTGGKQAMTKMSPANYDGKDHEDEKTSNNGNRIDYASTLEQAYDNIENIIGEEGVRGLTDQTKSLMNQQKQLMDNMKDMGPLLKSAEGFMKQITGGGGIGGITEMLKGFAPAKPASK
jgi:hypothetical protein